jgi:uncharacterized membrane protein YeaQ/YmgE (transglycosylase-associated protein family)
LNQEKQSLHYLFIERERLFLACARGWVEQGITTMGVLLWIVLIGLVAGIIARLLMPGPNKPKGFVVTTGLGIAGAFLATIVGDAAGLYRPGQGAGLIGATVGALVILFVWNRLVASRVIPDHGV